MTNTTLAAAADRVRELSRPCHDATVPVRDLQFDGLGAARIAGEAYPLRDTAQAAVASRLGVPIAYLKKCPPELQAYNLNHWLEREPNDELVLRFDGPAV